MGSGQIDQMCRTSDKVQTNFRANMAKVDIFGYPGHDQCQDTMRRFISDLYPVNILCSGDKNARDTVIVDGSKVDQEIYAVAETGNEELLAWEYGATAWMGFQERDFDPEHLEADSDSEADEDFVSEDEPEEPLEEYVAQIHEELSDDEVRMLALYES